jgi:hypothetical protein
MSQTETRPFRMNVGIALFNAAGRVLIAHRYKDDGPEIIAPGHDWQMPQGGIDPNEDPQPAAIRELYEETGVKSVTYLGETGWFDYDAKYNGQVQEITPARIAPEVAERVSQITSHIYDILHCNGIIRIDYIISPEGKISMLEVNTTPGMTATSFIPQQVAAAGLKMADVLSDIVENQLG